MVTSTVSNPNQLEAYLVEPVNPDHPNTWAIERPDPTWPLEAPIIEAVCDTAEQARRVAAGLVALQVAEQMLGRAPISASDGQWLAFRMLNALRFARGTAPAEPTNQVIVEAGTAVRIITPPAFGVRPVTLDVELTARLCTLYRRDVDGAQGQQPLDFGEWLAGVLRELADSNEVLP